MPPNTVRLSEQCSCAVFPSIYSIVPPLCYLKDGGSAWKQQEEKGYSSLFFSSLLSRFHLFILGSLFSQPSSPPVSSLLLLLSLSLLSASPLSPGAVKRLFSDAVFPSRSRLGAGCWSCDPNLPDNMEKEPGWRVSHTQPHVHTSAWTKTQAHARPLLLSDKHIVTKHIQHADALKRACAVHFHPCIWILSFVFDR